MSASAPKLSRVTVLLHPANPIHPNFLKRIQSTEKANNVTISPIEASTASQIEAAFGAMTRERTGALIVLGDSFFGSQARRIAELAAQQRLPTMFWTRGPVES